MSPSPGRVPDELTYLFIVTYGRSGSTLLQGILNSIPGFLIRGENRQVLRHHFEADRTLHREKRKHVRWIERNQPGEPLPVTHAFYGIESYPRSKALRLVRKFALQTVLRPEPDTRVVGFKEIRWSDPDTPQFVAWLQRVFPGARFVVNTRNLDDVAASAWWRDDSEARSHLERTEQQLLDLAEDLGEDAFHVHFDDYLADPSSLEPLFAWLGEDFDLAHVQQIMGVRHSWPYHDGHDGTA